MFLPLLLVGLQGPSPQGTEAPGQQEKPAEIRANDLSDYLGILLAADLAGGVDSSHHQASLFGGIKIGVPVGLKGSVPPTLLRTMTLDVAYDRIQASDGFSGELSMMLPIARFPTPRTSAATYARVYAEPGVGYRVGSGSFGGYASAKAMLALFSDDRLTLSSAPPSFFLEFQRRFPVTAPLRGDIRVVFGVMLAVCNHCGLN